MQSMKPVLSANGFLQVFYLSGTFPFKPYSPKSVNVIWKYLGVKLVAVIFHLAHYYYVSKKLLDSKIMGVVSPIVNFIYICIAFLIPLEIVYRKNKVQRALNILADMQNKLYLKPFKCIPLIKCAVGLLLVLAVAFVAHIFLVCYPERDPMPLKIVTFATYLYHMLHAFQFACLITTAGRCFSEMTRQLLTYSINELLIPISIAMYNQLMKVCFDLGDCFNLQITAFLFAYSLLIINQCLNLIADWDIMNYVFFIKHTLWLIAELLMVITIIHTCESVKTKAEEFNKAFYDRILREKNENIQGKPIVLLHVAGKNSVTFTACNFVNIDYRLGISLCAACITYFVLLVQLSEK